VADIIMVGNTALTDPVTKEEVGDMSDGTSAGEGVSGVGSPPACWT
jgi:hypothetical protein